jgi:hypothetical protein
LDEGYGVDIVYLDFRKAFDSVLHMVSGETEDVWIERQNTNMDRRFVKVKNYGNGIKRSFLKTD